MTNHRSYRWRLTLQTAALLSRRRRRRRARAPADTPYFPLQTRRAAICASFSRRAQVDVVVGTPGRLIDHLSSEALDLSQVKVAVLDEADEMLKMGFQQDVEQIMSYLPSAKPQKPQPDDGDDALDGDGTPLGRGEAQRRQMLLWSATVPSWVRQVSAKFMHR